MTLSRDRTYRIISAHGSDSSFGTGVQPRRRWCAYVLRIALAGAGVLCLAFPARGSARRAARHESSRVSGVVLKVEPAELTLQVAGAPLILTTFEDYRDEVAVGSQVTAWYYPQDPGANVLKSLSYPPESFFVPVNEIGRRVRRTILLPNSDVPDADGLWDSIREYLQAHLGWYVAPAFLAAEIRQRAARASSTLDAIDPASGNFDLSRYLSKTDAVIPKVAAESRVDAVLEADIQQVQAPVNRLLASWDSTEEPLVGPAIRTLAKLSVVPRKGEVPAATVTLKLWDAQGKLLWRNRRGLALLEVLEGKSDRLRQRPLPEFLINAQAVQAWLDSVFKNMLPEAQTAGAKPAVAP
jgi:hypothetical protein